MECEKLPIENASEPIEEAHQPEQEKILSPVNKMPIKRKNNVTFVEGTHGNDISSSQSSSTYKECLSQPAAGLSHRERLLWLQKRRHTGLWANCDSCGRWRYLPHILDAHELPAKWYCKFNPDKSASSCSVPEAPLHLREEEDLIHSEYSAGSVVWAQLAGWPAWPAMVDDCPDTEQFYWLDGFSDIPTHYNVVFFDDMEVTRAWVAPENLKPYGSNKKSFKLSQKDKKYKKRLDVAIAQADDADSLPLANRLAKYSFIARYRGTINKPRKVSKKDLRKYQSKLKRKFNIQFDIESASESDEDFDRIEKRQITKKNKAQVTQKNVSETSKNKTTKKKQAKLPETKTVEEANNLVEELDNTRNSEPKHQFQDFNNNETTEETVECENQSNEKCNKEIDETKDQTEDQIESATFKQPADSMVVQIGSTGPTSGLAPAELSVASFDNDTSNTYVPETETETESETITNIKETLKDVREIVRTTSASPCSDDFEF